MTKPLVQGQLGYWTNGVCVHMPQRAQAKKVERPTHITRNKEWKEYVKNQARQKSFHRQQRRQLTASHKAFVLPESIKIASKTGKSGHALCELIYTAQKLKKCTTISLPYFNIICRLIFIPDIEERSALYYAALTGHTQLVELYLSLYLLCSVIITKSTTQNEFGGLTFSQWFDKLGTRNMCLGKKFSKADYDVCVLNALSEDVRHVMTKKKITIEYALNVVNSIVETFVKVKLFCLANAPWKAIVGKMEDVETKMKQLKMIEIENTRRLNKARKPMLVCDFYNVDDYQLNPIDEDEHYYDEEYKDCEEEKEEDLSASTAKVDSSEECFDLDQYEQQLEELEELVSYSRHTDDFSIISNDDDDDTFNSSNYSLIIDNDVPSISLEGKVVSNDEEVEETSEDDGWDVVSEVESVKSVTSSTTKLSYKEILMENASASASNEKPVAPLKVPSQIPVSKILNSSSNESHNSNPSSSFKLDHPTDDFDNELRIFTCEDERDGIKSARGGKSNKMFKKEGRTKQQYSYRDYDRSGCRRASRNRKFGNNRTSTYS